MSEQEEKSKPENMIFCKCPFCGEVYSVPASYGGQKIECGKCRKKFIFQKAQETEIEHTVKMSAAAVPETDTAKTMKISAEAISAGTYKSKETLEERIAQAKSISEKSTAQFQPGQMIGRYQIERCLGVGGMGEVYLVKDLNLGCYRALKTLLQKISVSPEQKERFLREARIAALIQHKAVVGVVEIVLAENSPEHITYIVMEYVDGGSVADFLKKGPLAELESLRIIRQAAEALKAAQSVQLVHRDIKPANIMVTKDGDVKIADFGIASSRTEEFGISTTLTMEGDVVGTPAYASPEQCRDSHEVDVRADIYSLGVSLFEMLTGKLPYSGKNAYDLMIHAANDSIPDPRTINPKISDRTTLLVMRMMAKKPEDRPQNPEQLILALDVILNQEKISSPELQDLFKRLVEERTTQTALLSRTNSRMFLRTIGAAVLVFLVIGCVAVYFVRGTIAESAKQIRHDYENDLRQTNLTLQKAIQDRDFLQLSLQSTLTSSKRDEKQIRNLTKQFADAENRVAQLEKDVSRIKNHLDKETPGVSTAIIRQTTLPSLARMEPQPQYQTQPTTYQAQPRPQSQPNPQPQSKTVSNLTDSEKALLEKEKARGIKFSDDCRVLIRYPESLTGTEYTVPDFVREIGARAFSGCKMLEKAVLHPQLQKIGDDSFASCYSLQEIVIPYGITEIGKGAFRECKSLKTFHMPDSVKKVGSAFLAECSTLKTLVLSKNLTELPFRAFFDSGLERITIPQNITLISSAAFQNCKDLQEVEIPDGIVLQHNVFDNCRKLEKVRLPADLKVIEDRMFLSCSKLKAITLPKNMTEIKICSFWDCTELEHIYLPDNVKVIGKSAFSGCKNLKNVRLPEKLVVIDDKAFYGCTNLREVNIPSGIKYLAPNAFNGCQFQPGAKKAVPKVNTEQKKTLQPAKKYRKRQI